MMPEPQGDPLTKSPIWQSRKGRANSALMLIAAVVLALTELLLIRGVGRYFPFILLLVPSLVLTGIAGLIEPRIALAVSPDAKAFSLPLWTRIIGYTLMVGGMVVGAWLAWVYL